MRTSKLIFRVHAIQRMFERNLSLRTVSRAVETGETIEDYSAEMSDAGRLILGFRGRSPLHVVTSENRTTDEITIITAYIPDASRWSNDFRSRRA